MLTRELHISDNTELKKVERAMIIRLDRMDQRLSTIETLLRSVAQPSNISEFLIKPCQSPQELEDLCSSMKDTEYRKKTVSKFNSRLYDLIYCIFKNATCSFIIIIIIKCDVTYLM